MWFLFAILSAVFAGLTGFLMKISQMKKGNADYLLFAIYLTGSIGFLIQCLFDNSLHPGDLRLWFWGAIIGAGSAWANSIYMKALELGPASLTSPLMNLNIVFVMILATFYYNEPLSFLKAFGAFLLILAASLFAVRVKEPLSIREKKWFLLVILGGFLLFLRSGGLKITTELGLPNTEILLYSYVLSAIWFGFSLKKPTATTSHSAAQVRAFNRTGLIWGLVSGIFSYGGLQLYSVSLQSGPATSSHLFFPHKDLWSSSVPFCSIKKN